MWKFFKDKTVRRAIAAGVLVLILVVAFIVESRVLPPIAVNRLAELTNTQVKADEVNFGLNGAVRIRDLQVKPAGQRVSYDNTILRAKEVYVRFGILSLLLFEPEVRKVSVHNFVIEVQQDIDTGDWNIDELKFGGGEGGDEIPVVRLKHGQVRYSRILGGEKQTAVSIPLDASLERSDERDGYDFELTTAAAEGSRFSSISGHFEKGRLSFSGGISSEDLPATDQVWTIDNVSADYRYSESGDFKLDAKIENFTTEDKSTAKTILEKPRLVKEVKAASVIGRLFERYRLIGSADIRVQAAGNRNRPGQINLDGTISCKGVSILYSAFPYLIENVEGDIDFSRDRVEIKELRGNHGEVQLTIVGEFSDFAEGTRGYIKIKSDNMLLDDDLYSALRPVQRELWDEFEPNGVVAFEYVQRRKPGGNEYGLDVELLGVDSIYRHFPYPLNDLTGRLFFDRDSIDVNGLNSKKGNRRININGEVTGTDTARPRFDLIIDVNNVPLDETLCGALPARERNLYNQFQPTGFGSGTISVRNKKDDVNEVDFTAKLDFTNTVLRPPMLPQPINDITARGIFKPDSIEFTKFSGLYAGRAVSMEGVFEPTADGKDITYSMTLHSGPAEIDEALLNLIPQRLAETVSELNPSGRVSYTARLDKKSRTNDTNFDFRLRCEGVSAKPDILDFALHNITGEIVADSNLLILKDIKSHGFDANAPAFTINGRVETVAGAGSAPGGIEAATVDIDVNNLPVEEKRIQNLQARLEYDPEGDLWFADSFVGNFYEGRLFGRIELAPADGESPEFRLQSSFDNVNLRRFLADGRELPAGCEKGRCYSRGVMSGTVNVSGTVNETASYLGNCRVEIEQMRVGKLSLIARLLSVLKLTEPQDYAFERMFFDAYIKDGRLYFENLELSGAALTFAGTGWMDMTDRRLDLTLAARGPRITAVEEDLIGSLASALSPGVLQVHIGGTAYEPEIQVKPFPVIRDTLELLGTKE